VDQRPASEVAQDTPAGADKHAGRRAARHHLKAAEASGRRQNQTGTGAGAGASSGSAKPAPTPAKPMSELSFAELLAGALDAYRETRRLLHFIAVNI